MYEAILDDQDFRPCGGETASGEQLGGAAVAADQEAYGERGCGCLPAATMSSWKEVSRHRSRPKVRRSGMTSGTQAAFLELDVDLDPPADQVQHLGSRGGAARGPSSAVARTPLSGSPSRSGS